MNSTPHSTPHIASKAARLLAAGRVRPDLPASVYKVAGDTGTYTVVLSAHLQLCTCPAAGYCSHIEAADRYDSADEEEQARFDRALASRHAEDRVEADAVLARLDRGA